VGRKIPVIEGAGRTGISDKTLRAWIRQGKIVGYRVGDQLLMVDADEVDQLAPGPSQERVMPGDERGRSEESAPMQNDLAARRDQSKDATEVDHLDQVLRD
jgi:excisionase family DNA binding protein